MRTFTTQHTLADITAATNNSVILDVPGHSIQLWYGDPAGTQVKHYHGSTVDKEYFPDAEQAITRFLALCATVIK